MRMLIAGGGTGGHLFPGIALAEEVVTRHPQNSVLFVGTARGLESKVLPQTGFPLELIDAVGLKRKGLSGFLAGLLKLPRALFASMRILRKFDPDVVVGVGGYASGPVVLAAWLLRIPTAIQEQNALPGFTNRVLGHFARATFIAFEEARRRLAGGRIYLLGNPIRRAFLDNYLKPHPTASADRFTILITGGSQGAHVLNDRVAGALELLTDLRDRLFVMHQTGDSDRNAIAERYAKSGISAEVNAFISDMSGVYARADLVVCRAGATTLAELTACKRASILVPFPFAADDHQTVNARALVDAGAAVMIAEQELTPERLATEIRALITDDTLRRQMERAAGTLGRPQAAKEIADVCVELCIARLVREGRDKPLPKAKKGSA